jgi:hypothetical protein
MNNKLEKDICIYRTTPEAIVALRSAAVGGLAGLFVLALLNR